MNISVISNPSNKEKSIIEEGIIEYNKTHAQQEWEEIVIHAKNIDGDIVGGMTGHFFWDWFYLQFFWLQESYRKQKLGTELLKNLELLCLDRSIYRIHLETTDFQALEFYLKNGFEKFGEIEKPLNHKHYFLKKVLQVD